MTALNVVAVLLLVLFLLGLVRVGGIAEYGKEGLFVWVRAGFAKIRVIPAKRKKPGRKPGPRPRQAEKPPEEEPPKEDGGPLHLVKLYLPLVGEAAGELKKRIRIDRLFLDYISAGEAADAALAFGSSNVALGVLWPVIWNNFEVKDHRIRTAVDFEAEGPTLYVNAAFSARMGQLVSFLIRFGLKALKIYLRDTKEQKARLAAEMITKEANQ